MSEPPEQSGTTWHRLEQRLRAALALPRRPVAVAFCDEPPPGVAPFRGREPAGCGFWRRAAQGQVFYTVPADHYHCAIGSYTHRFSPPAEQRAAFEQTFRLMTDSGYLRPEELSQLLQLPHTPGVVVYAPLGATPVAPDVVLLAGRPGRLMLVWEAAQRVGAAAQLPLLGRPTCMALPAALARGTVLSLGCIGNRLYTDLGEDELYVALPGQALPRVVDALAEVASANAQLADYHRQRRQQLTRE
ncbi:MAG TPA: DUF169 domain-containing protein [Chloroflexota bacterium]|nr:DUF169 domain-containing protein [Chloroflexota bacterium]